jgi:hypothetical protein
VKNQQRSRLIKTRLVQINEILCPHAEQIENQKEFQRAPFTIMFEVSFISENSS